MKKRQFLFAAAAAGVLPTPKPAFAASPGSGPALLTVGGGRIQAPSVTMTANSNRLSC